MKLMTIAGATLLLGGCVASTSDFKPMTPTIATKMEPPACTRGVIDDKRAFILCETEDYTQADVALAMTKPALADFTIASVATEFGVRSQSTRKIEAATYAQIVARTPERRPRESMDQARTIVIDGREFRQVPLAAKGKRSVTLFVEK